MAAYGNLINRIQEHSLCPTPEVGMGATIYWFSDRTAGTVTKVSASGKTVEITEDRVVEWRNDYGVRFESDPNGRVYVARQRRNGTWKAAGNGVTLGARAAYYDRSF